MTDIVVKLTFNPADLKMSDEAWPAFHYGGMTLTFWALYKRSHLTPDTFRDGLVALGEYYKSLDLIDDENQEDQLTPYSSIDEFNDLLKLCGICRPSGKWLADLWDHFNLNIRRSVLIEYEAMEPVIKRLRTNEASLNKGAKP